jgi:hypothetical protein
MKPGVLRVAIGALTLTGACDGTAEPSTSNVRCAMGSGVTIAAGAFILATSACSSDTLSQLRERVLTLTVQVGNTFSVNVQSYETGTNSGSACPRLEKVEAYVGDFRLDTLSIGGTKGCRADEFFRDECDRCVPISFAGDLGELGPPVSPVKVMVRDHSDQVSMDVVDLLFSAELALVSPEDGRVRPGDPIVFRLVTQPARLDVHVRLVREDGFGFGEFAQPVREGDDLLRLRMPETDYRGRAFLTVNRLINRPGRFLEVRNCTGAVECTAQGGGFVGSLAFTVVRP